MTFPKSKLLELNDNKNVSTGFCLSKKKKNVPEHIELLIALTNAFLDVFLMYISIIQKNVYFESSDLKFSFCNSKRDL